MLAAMPWSCGGMIWQPLPQYTCSAQHTAHSTQYTCSAQYTAHSTPALHDTAAHMDGWMDGCGRGMHALGGMRLCTVFLPLQSDVGAKGCHLVQARHLAATALQTERVHACAHPQPRTLYPLYSLGLCDAVTMTPPAAPSSATPAATNGVGTMREKRCARMPAAAMTRAVRSAHSLEPCRAS